MKKLERSHLKNLKETHYVLNKEEERVTKGGCSPDKMGEGFWIGDNYYWYRKSECTCTDGGGGAFYPGSGNYEGYTSSGGNGSTGGSGERYGSSNNPISGQHYSILVNMGVWNGGWVMIDGIKCYMIAEVTITGYQNNSANPAGFPEDDDLYYVSPSSSPDYWAYLTGAGYYNAAPGGSSSGGGGSSPAESGNDFIKVDDGRCIAGSIVNAGRKLGIKLNALEVMDHISDFWLYKFQRYGIEIDQLEGIFSDYFTVTKTTEATDVTKHLGRGKPVSMRLIIGDFEHEDREYTSNHDVILIGLDSSNDGYIYFDPVSGETGKISRTDMLDYKKVVQGFYLLDKK